MSDNNSNNSSTSNSSTTRRKRRGKRKNKDNEEGSNLLDDLTVAYNGRYVRVDDKLLKKLKQSHQEPEPEPPRINPFEETPGMTDIIKSGRPLTFDFLNECSESHHADPVARNMADMIGNIPVDWLALRRSKMQEDNWEYNHKMSVEPIVTAQGSTGLCWAHSSLNFLRYSLMKNLGLEKHFEFSEAYVFFWDKIERINWMLESAWALRDRPLNDRYFSLYLTGNNGMSLISDGGLWEFFKNLVQKYGLLPKSMYNDCFNSSVSQEMNDCLINISSYMILNIHNNRDNWSNEQFSEYKDESMKKIYDLVVRFLGEPPKRDEKFDWRYKTSDGQFKELKGLTAMKLYQISAPDDFATKFLFICDERYPENYYKTHFLEHGNNMVGGSPVYMINIPKDVMKKAVAESLINDTSVWFGADVSYDFDWESKTFDSERFDYGAVLGSNIREPIVDMQTAKLTIANHAMLFVGVEISNEDSESPEYIKWRLCNSWGYDSLETEKDNGFYRMTDDWFDRYVHMAVIDLKFFPEEVCKEIIQNKHDPITVKPWDIFGSVAMRSTCQCCQNHVKKMNRELLRKTLR